MGFQDNIQKSLTDGSVNWVEKVNNEGGLIKVSINPKDPMSPLIYSKMRIPGVDIERVMQAIFSPEHRLQWDQENVLDSLVIKNI